MCQFISAVLPSHADVEAVAAVFRAHGRFFSPRRADSAIVASFASGERIFGTTPGHCDCGTPLGSAHDAWSARRDDPEIEAARLRRKGWSEAKIARAIEQRAEAKSRPPRPRAEPAITSLSVWRELIEAVLASRATPSLGLVLHGMEHPNDFEDFPVSGRERIAHNRLNEAVLASMREDTLYDFAR
ncbi:MAG: hypothetical protein KA144_06180 [Xanthomonadaceae bacterium]|nr:hypothetical protein [Xanthomonadaceae bacterium]